MSLRRRTALSVLMVVALAGTLVNGSTAQAWRQRWASPSRSQPASAVAAESTA